MRHLTNRTAKGVIIIWILMIMIWMNCAGGRRPPEFAAWFAEEPGTSAGGGKRQAAAVERAPRPDVAAVERATGPGAAIGRGGLITAPATVAVPTGTGDILKRDLRGRSACFSSSTAALICWHGEPRGAKGTAAAEIPARAGCWVSWLNGGI